MPEAQPTAAAPDMERAAPGRTRMRPRAPPPPPPMAPPTFGSSAPRWSSSLVAATEDTDAQHPYHALREEATTTTSATAATTTAATTVAPLHIEAAEDHSGADGAAQPPPTPAMTSPPKTPIGDASRKPDEVLGRASWRGRWRLRSRTKKPLSTATSSSSDDSDDDLKMWWQRERAILLRRLCFWCSATALFGVCFGMAFLVPQELQPLAPAVIGSLLSFVSGLTIVVSYLLQPKNRRHPNELLVYVALCEVGLALLALVHVMIYCSNGTAGASAVSRDRRLLLQQSPPSHFQRDLAARPPAACKPITFESCSIINAMEMFLLLASVGWFGAAIFHLFVSVTNPFANYKSQLKLYHVMVWSGSIVIAVIVPLVVLSKGVEEAYGLSAVEICRTVSLVFPMLASYSSEEEQRQRVRQWQQLNLAYWGTLFAFIVLMVVAAQVILVMGWWRSNSGTVIALKARRRMMRRMTVYVHTLNASWVVILVIFFVYRSSDYALQSLMVSNDGLKANKDATDSSTGSLNVLDAIFHFLLTGKGYFVCVVWLSVNRSCCAVFCKDIHRESDEGGSLSEVETQHMSSTSLNSMEAAALNQHHMLQQQHMTLLGRPTLTGPTNPAAARSDSLSSAEEWASQNDETLQREIIYYTVCGITKAIDKSGNASAHVPAQELMVGAERDSIMATNSILTGVQHMHMTGSPLSMLRDGLDTHGFCHAARPHGAHHQHLDQLHPDQFQIPAQHHHSRQSLPTRFSLYPVTHVPFELFESEIELQSNRSSPVFAGFRRTATALSQPRRIDDPKPKVFVDYAPNEFRSIRTAFGLTDDMYLASFRATAKERVSAGSSGAFMFFSGDNSLIVKSMKEKECRKLVRMVPKYADYIRRNPKSRIIRFFGCHRIRLYGRNFYFVVMANVLHSANHAATISEKYDIKGSWVDRKAKPLQVGETVTCSECNAQYPYSEVQEPVEFPYHLHRPDIILKDMDLKRHLHLAPELGESLYAQLASDADFLKSMGIMDYSLLVGIHKCRRREPWLRAAVEAQRASDHPVNGSLHLAPIGEDNLVTDEVYFVGIIDILQEWDLEKQLERYGKVLIGKSPTGISAVDPELYCERFKRRLVQLLQVLPPSLAVSDDENDHVGNRNHAGNRGNDPVEAEHSEQEPDPDPEQP